MFYIYQFLGDELACAFSFLLCSFLLIAVQFFFADILTALQSIPPGYAVSSENSLFFFLVYVDVLLYTYLLYTSLSQSPAHPKFKVLVNAQTRKLGFKKFSAFLAFVCLHLVT